MRWSRAAAYAGAALLACAGQEASAFTVNTTPLSSREKNIETLGTGVAIALPVVAGGIALYKHDKVGVAQLLVESALTVGTAYALKNIVRERRPDGSDYKSFPSETTALAASGSSFLWRRYGTLASSGIAAGYSALLGTRFKARNNIDTWVEAAPDGAKVGLSYRW
jgi:hypothetical protein